MDVFKRNQYRFRSLPRCFSSFVRSLSFERSNNENFLSNTPTIPRRRNGISMNSSNDSKNSNIEKTFSINVFRSNPTKEFLIKNIDFPICSSSYYILTLINECSTLILLNKDCELYRIDLRDKLILINDICWSFKLNEFLLSGYSVYSFDPRSFQLKLIDEIQLNRGEWIISITTDFNSIYLLYSSRSSRIERRSIYFPQLIEKNYSQKSFLQDKDFLAQCIRINQLNIIALTIKQTNGQWRIDLFNSNDFKRMYKGSTLGQSIPGMRNCLVLPYHHLWIIINNCSISQQIILIDQKGKIKDKTNIHISDGFFNLCFIGDQWIAMNSKDKLQLFQIQ